jgi:murein DD-endopeptidase MepM/ murein hydrolase activator NlpD
MSPSKHQTQSRLRSSIQTQLLYQGAFWFSSLSLLNGGIVMAQTPAGEAIAPITATLQTPVEPSPVTPPASLEAPAPVPASEFVQPVAPSSNKPNKSVNLSVSNDAYIDSTSYAIGATNRSGQAGTGSQRDRTPSALSIGNPNERGTGELPALKPPVTYAGGTTASGQRYLRSFQLPINRNIGNMRLIFPLSMPSPITSLFGWRFHPISGVLRFHSGTDLGAPLGTPVLAAYAGRVAIADFLGGYGLAVALQHQKDTQETLYAHLSEVFVKPGQWVKQGDVIGRVGDTGTATGPNLHFELRQSTSEGWTAIDSGIQLEYALAELAKAWQTNKAPVQAQSTSPKQVIRYVSREELTIKLFHPFELRQLTSEGWVTLNPSAQLEYALAQLLKALQPAKPLSQSHS